MERNNKKMKEEIAKAQKRDEIIANNISEGLIMTKHKKDEVDLKKKLITEIARTDISIAKLSRKADLNSGSLYNFLKGRSQLGANSLTKVLLILSKL